MFYVRWFTQHHQLHGLINLHNVAVKWIVLNPECMGDKTPRELEWILQKYIRNRGETTTHILNLRDRKAISFY